MIPAGRRMLLLLIGALSLVLALEWLWPDRVVGPRIAASPRAGGRAAPAQQTAERDTANWGDTVLARPLFSISRRPPRVVASAHSDAAPSQARLAGIMITRYAKRAIFAPDGGGKQLVLAEGAAINDSTIASIQPHRVTLASGSVLLPAYDKNRSGPIPTTPPFQPPGFQPPNFQPGGAGPTGVFPNPGFPNPNFPNPGMLNPNLLNPGAMPPNPNAAATQGQTADDSGAPAPVQALPPVMRGTVIPQRRE